ncbi:MAG: hypothetical protein ACYDCC_09955 [Actinomycetota bacterium]
MLEHAIHPSNALRRRLAMIQWPRGISLVFPAILVLAFVMLLILRGFMRDAGILLLAQSAVLVAAVSRTRFASRFEDFSASVADAVADAIPLAALAWPLRSGSMRVGVAVVAAIGCVFLGAYARVKATSVGFRVPPAMLGAPERSAILAIGLMVQRALPLEIALWLVAAFAFVSALGAGIAVWRQAG